MKRQAAYRKGSRNFQIGVILTFLLALIDPASAALGLGACPAAPAMRSRNPTTARLQVAEMTDALWYEVASDAALFPGPGCTLYALEDSAPEEAARTAVHDLAVTAYYGGIGPGQTASWGLTLTEFGRGLADSKFWQPRWFPGRGPSELWLLEIDYSDEGAALFYGCDRDPWFGWFHHEYIWVLSRVPYLLPSEEVRLLDYIQLSFPSYGLTALPTREDQVQCIDTAHRLVATHADVVAEHAKEMLAEAEEREA